MRKNKAATNAKISTKLKAGANSTGSTRSNTQKKKATKARKRVDKAHTGSFWSFSWVKTSNN